MEICRYSEICQRTRRTKLNYCYLEEHFFVQEYAIDLLSDLDYALEVNSEHIQTNGAAKGCQKKSSNTARLISDRTTMDRLYRERFKL